MIDGEFPPHGAHLTVVVVANTQKRARFPTREDSGRIQIVAAIVTALLAPDRNIAANQEETGIAYWIGAFFD